jgi:hypothetical protein
MMARGNTLLYLTFAIYSVGNAYRRSPTILQFLQIVHHVVWLRSAWQSIPHMGGKWSGQRVDNAIRRRGSVGQVFQPID